MRRTLWKYSRHETSYFMHIDEISVLRAQCSEDDDDNDC